MRFREWFWSWWLNKWIGRSATFTSLSANRRVYRSSTKFREVTVIVRDRTRSDGYCREDLYTMLAMIRYHEKQQKWQVPEPDAEAIASCGNLDTMEFMRPAL